MSNKTVIKFVIKFGIKSKKSDLNSKKRGVFNEILLFIF